MRASLSLRAGLCCGDQGGSLTVMGRLCLAGRPAWSNSRPTQRDCQRGPPDTPLTECQRQCCTMFCCHERPF
ncbi:hypothetical protein CALCODRAFT_19543 [Calocera cornea HHB12733]|uniref:Uncharacterized protein n=1 Tax=Calocera cornea HHB12733 TaxID=1353952 RepID=A0A165E6E0_9BASI|nr:hypothetical protein CALCODRAFT_19543 [Calocera cornea HHB12733]